MGSSEECLSLLESDWNSCNVTFVISVSDNHLSLPPIKVKVLGEIRGHHEGILGVLAENEREVSELPALHPRYKVRTFLNFLY